jgi:hypothetical protein
MLAMNHGADGVSVMEYEPEKSGGPLHIMNMTINETVGCESQLQQRDRKGVGMAVGPAGISQGVSDHALWLRGRIKPTFATALHGKIEEPLAQAVDTLFEPTAEDRLEEGPPAHVEGLEGSVVPDEREAPVAEGLAAVEDLVGLVPLVKWAVDFVPSPDDVRLLAGYREREGRFRRQAMSSMRVLSTWSDRAAYLRSVARIPTRLRGRSR